MNKSKIAFFSIILILLLIFIIRLVSPSQIDDVNPQRLCEEKYLEKSDILFVIPLLYNESISDNETWCESIKELNKTIGMHGTYHDGKEFSRIISEEEMLKGMEEFKKCFGFYPELFESPELSISKENEELLKKLNLTILKRSNYVFHKAYHCTDYEKKSWLVKLNYFNNLI